MMTRQLAISAAFFTILLTAGTASAGPSLSATFSGPSAPYVYEMNRYEVTVKNTGNGQARNVTLEIVLPETNNSPTPYLMGEVGGHHSGCTLSGTSLFCNLGRIKGGKSKTRWIDLSFPISTNTIAVLAYVDSNNAGTAFDFVKPYLETYDEPLTGPVDMTNRHCTGMNLSSFIECEYAPSSIGQHQIRLEANGSITFLVPNNPPGFTGTWSQSADNHLTFSYYANGDLRMTFNGFGNGDGCFEGITVFPNSSYVSAYEVCL